jgi:hypothetical protein
MKVLVIKNGGDIDIIVEDGSYAFLYDTEESWLLNLYQGRIERAIADFDPSEDVATSKTDKMYVKEYGLDSELPFMINEALNWLCVGETDFEIEYKTVKFNEDSFLLINEFLKLK